MTQPSPPVAETTTTGAAEQLSGLGGLGDLDPLMSGGFAGSAAAPQQQQPQQPAQFVHALQYQNMMLQQQLAANQVGLFVH
jgi:hypothetical protein